MSCHIINIDIHFIAYREIEILGETCILKLETIHCFNLLLKEKSPLRGPGEVIFHLLLEHFQEPTCHPLTQLPPAFLYTTHCLLRKLSSILH